MAVVIETTLGDITVDLYLEQRPATCLNFLKLCKMKYYNFNLFHTIRSGFIAQTGDPTGEGSGGESIWGLLEGSAKRFFSGEKMPKIRHTDAGLLSMVCTDNMMVGSQFFFTLAPDLDSLDSMHCVIGEVTEGHEVLTKLNEVICDETHRPYQDVRITHTVILEDPFNDLPGLRPPSRSPSPNAERLKGGRIAPDEELDETQGKSHQEIQEMIEEKEAKARATILEIVGDLPDADIAPPENVLFVCKLNPVTTDDDLEIIFSRFGKIVSCEVIRDKRTGDSLQYAFIEFEDKKSCEDAYFKMDNVLIDDRRIHVDFSQSVSKMRWLGKGRGVQYFNDTKPHEIVNNESKRKKRSHSRERNDKRYHYNDRDNRERNKTYRNDKSSDLRKERDSSRSRPRRDRHSKSDQPHNDRNHSRESNSNRHYKNNYSSKNKDENRHDDYDKVQKKKVHSSSTKNDRREHSRSPIRKRKENTDNKKNYKREKSNDRHINDKHKSSNRNAENRSQDKEIKHSKDLKKLEEKKEYSKPNSREACEAGPHTPSPVTNEKHIESKKNDKIKTQKKMKNNARKTKKRRKPSTSSSTSETSDSSSSSSESTSSSEGDRKKRKVKKRKRRHSSSTSTSSSTSSSDSSTSSTSSSDSSASTSESDGGKKKRKKNSNKKSGKKTKNL